LGGKFQDGFLSAAASAGASNAGLLGNPNAKGAGAVASRTIRAGIVGGTASALGGGKFANGAWTASFQHLLNAELEVLVGGAYKDHPFGHAALKISDSSGDAVYDFGRYGKVWGTGDSLGQGILRVWGNFKAYISGENALGRTTTGYSWNISDADAARVRAHYDGLANYGGKPDAGGRPFTRYQLKNDYDAVVRNCTTMTLDGLSVAKGINVMNMKYHDSSGLGIVERTALMTQKIMRPFIPSNIHNMMKENSPDRINTYR